MDWNNPNLIETLREDGVVVMPTDTLYGIVGNALSEQVVNRIYTTRKRNPEKPCIILIGDISELEKFSVELSESQKEKIKEYWAGENPTSIVFDCVDEKFAYLHRGTKTLAFRLPANEDLRNLLKQVGPLVAPSANLEGFPPAKTIEEAKKYFGDLVDPVRGRGSLRALAASNGVDLYADGGEISGQASRVIRLRKDGSVDVLRA